MLQGEPLSIDSTAPVSPKLLRQVHLLQEVLHSWQPLLREIPIVATPGRPGPPRAGAASFFSGGLDSIYTFWRHADEVTHLIFIRGFDIALDNGALAEAATRRNEQFARSFSKRLLVVNTNLRLLCYPNTPITLLLFHGTMLASVGLALGFPITYIPAAHTYRELLPSPTHPITDPLWSNERTDFVHDGAVRRSDKLRAIASCKEALEVLRPCWANEQYNCGKCSKCLRTMTSARLLRIDLPSLPRLKSTLPIWRLQVAGIDDLAYFRENLALARRIGDYRMWLALQYRVLCFRMRKQLAGLDRLVLGGQLRRLARGISRRSQGAARAPRKLSLELVEE
jgi:hypothetical protein